MITNIIETQMQGKKISSIMTSHPEGNAYIVGCPFQGSIILSIEAYSENGQMATVPWCAIRLENGRELRMDCAGMVIEFEKGE